MSDISDSDLWDEDNYMLSSEEIDELGQSSDSEEEEYEEEQRISKTRAYDNLLKRYPIDDLGIKEVIERKMVKIDVETKNYTLLIASIIVLAKNGNKIDNNFSSLCDDVIETIVKNDMNLENSDIDQLKRDLLRYCRFVQLCTK
jgi:hypothetical protein